MPDPAAFLDEPLPLRDALYGFARKASFRPDLAADLVQQASLIAWREFPRFRPGTNFRAWMFRILVNTVHTSNKHAGRERRRADPVADPERLCGADLGAAFEQEEAWASVRSDPSRLADLLGDHLAAALGAVPEEPRTALLLRLIGDLTYREISGVLQLPVGTVMSHVHRARQEARRRLASREVARRAASGEPSSPSERTEGGAGMKCSDARARLSAYLDSELDAGSTFEVSRHIRSCPECAARFEEERRVDEAIGARLRGETLPDEAWTTIRLAVGASTRRRGRLVFAACAGVLSAVLLLGVGLRGFPWLQRIVRLGDRTPRVTWVEDRGRAEIAAMDDLAGAWIAATTGSAWRDSPDAGWVAAADPAAAAVELLQGAVLELCCEARGHATRLLATRRVAGPAGDALELRLECCGEPVLLRVVLSTVGPGQGFAVERAVAEDLRADAEERRVPDLAVVARRVGGVLAVAVARHPIGDLLDGLRVG